MSNLCVINHTGQISNISMRVKKEKKLDIEEAGTEDLSTQDNSTGRSSVRVRVKFEEEEPERQTALCFGSCCDVRRACLIVDTIYVLFSTWGVVRFTQGSSYFNYMGEQAQTVYSLKVYNEAAYIQLCLGIVFSLVGLLGSYTFRKAPVLLAAIWYIVDMILYVVFFNWPAAIIIALYCYPHMALFVALRKGTLTYENYSQTERHCCCSRCCRKDVDDDDDDE